MNAPAINVDARPEYGTLKALKELFGIAETFARELEHDGLIKFARIKRKGNVSVGKTLVNLDSVRNYLASCEATN